jgi:hypothetical protein
MGVIGYDTKSYLLRLPWLDRHRCISRQQVRRILISPLVALADA